jgi:hypothetical protein
MKVRSLVNVLQAGINNSNLAFAVRWVGFNRSFRGSFVDHHFVNPANFIRNFKNPRREALSLPLRQPCSSE